VDKLELYRSIVTEILTKYSQYKPSYGQVEIPQSGGYANEQIFDRDHDSPVGDAPRTISITRDRLESTTKNLWHDDPSRYSGRENLDSAKYDRIRFS
jgi:hypothetical protein